MYHKIEDQEKHPDKYVLAEVEPCMTEDECFYLFSKPRQTQKTIGLYLKKLKDTKKLTPPDCPEPQEKKRFLLTKGSLHLEREVLRNKGFWVDKPQISAPITYKLKEKYSVDSVRKKRKEQGIFYRPDYLELDYVMKLANAGLLYSDEEESESEEDEQPDNTTCTAFKKTKYKILDPCKEKKVKKEEKPKEPPIDLVEELNRKGIKLGFKKIQTGCQCDYLGEHNVPPIVWDNPFRDRIDMLRQHEMNKVKKPYKHELLIANYTKRPPVTFMSHESRSKKIFPLYQISNL